LSCFQNEECLYTGRASLGDDNGNSVASTKVFVRPKKIERLLLLPGPTDKKIRDIPDEGDQKKENKNKKCIITLFRKKEGVPSQVSWRGTKTVI